MIQKWLHCPLHHIKKFIIIQNHHQHTGLVWSEGKTITFMQLCLPFLPYLSETRWLNFLRYKQNICIFDLESYFVQPWALSADLHFPWQRKLLANGFVTAWDHFALLWQAGVVASTIFSAHLFTRLATASWFTLEKQKHNVSTARTQLFLQECFLFSKLCLLLP